MVEKVKRILIFTAFFILIFSIIPVYAQNYQNEINRLNLEKERINNEINNIEKLKNSYVNIMGLVEKGHSISQFFSPKDVSDYFGKNPSKLAVIQKLNSFIQEADDKTFCLKGQLSRIQDQISDIKLKEKFDQERAAEKYYEERQKERFRIQDEYNKKAEAIRKTNEVIDQIIDITTYYKANRPIPGYPNNNNVYLPFYPYFIKNTFPHIPIPPPPQSK